MGRGSTSKTINAVLALVESGSTLKAACLAVPGAPTPSSIQFYLNRRVDLRKRFDLAVERNRNARSRHSSAFEVILKLVASGLSVEQACRAPDCPRADSIAKWLRRRPELKTRFEEAKRAGATIRKARHTAEQKESFLRTVEGSRTQQGYLASIAQSVGWTSRSVRSKIWKLRKDPEFRARLKGAIEKFRKNNPRPVAQKRSADRPDGQLRILLSDNEIYNAAIAAVPRSQYGQNADDLIGEIVLLVLAGKIAIEDVKTIGLALAKKSLGRGRTQTSLDDFASSNGMTFVETQTTHDLVST